MLLPAPYNTRHVRRLHPGVLPRACNSYGSTAKGRLSYESYSPVLHRALGITREKNQIKKKYKKNGALRENDTTAARLTARAAVVAGEKKLHVLLARFP